MNAVNVGDVVYWYFVFDRPECEGVVVEIENNRCLVEQRDGGLVERRWMERDDFVSESELENYGS